MGFVHFNRYKYLTGKDGRPFYLTGVNFAPRYVCTDFWKDWRPELILEALDDVKSLGLNGIRIPVHWNTFEPQEGCYDENMFRRFDLFIQWCRERSLYIMPWFLIGVATGLYEIQWRRGRSILFDESMVSAAENHLRRFAARYKNEEQILAWDICDEPEWYTKMENSPDTLPYPAERFTGWVKRMYRAFKDTDPNHQVTLGFGHIALNHYGMDVPAIAGILDFMAVTTYCDVSCDPSERLQNDYILQYHLDVNECGKPVYMCECPGATSVMCGDYVIARLYTVTLYSGLLHGSCGVMPWVLNDYAEDIWHKLALNKNPAEQGFGIIDMYGNRKPAAGVLSRFGELAREMNIVDYSLPEAQVALVLPRNYTDSSCINTAYVPAHAVLSAIGIPVDVTWWNKNLTGYKIIVMPDFNGMLAEDWDHILGYVENGGILVCTGGGGNVFTPYMPRLFGVRPYCRVNGHMKLTPAGGEVFDVFDNGDPSAVINRYGRGTAVYTAGNILYPAVNEKAYDFFDMLTGKFGIRRYCRCGSRFIETGVLRHHTRNEYLMVIINHGETDEMCVIETDIPEIRKRTLEINLRAGEAIIKKIG